MGGGAGEKRDFDTQLRYLFDPTQKTGVTEYTTSTERAHEGVAIPRIPRVDKNASDKEAVIDSTGFPPCFTSTNTAEFNRDTTTFSRRYVKREPCFDRQSSCATNYSLGEAPFETKTTNDVLFAHPLTKPRVDQGEIGGWKHPDGSYKLEQEAIDSIKRGGGGGAGCLGISFNVITGEEIPGIREGKRAIYGARRTLNVTSEAVWKSSSRRWRPKFDFHIGNTESTRAIRTIRLPCGTFPLPRRPTKRRRC